MRVLPESKVKALLDLMNSTTLGKIPAQEPILDCFDLAMDEKMLDYLLAVGTELHTVEELEALYNSMYQDGRWQETWDEILLMSFLFPTPDNTKYMMSSFFPGWVELSVSGPLNEKRRAILNKFIEFWDTLYDMNVPHIRAMSDGASIQSLNQLPARMTSYVSHGSREISLNQPLTSEQQVYTGGEVFRLLERHQDQIAVMNCFCRQHKQMNGGDECNIGIPVEACISLGAISRQLVNSGVARHLPYEEAVALMEDFERKGCVHTAFHYGHNVENEEIVICNCCNDCCELYGAYQKGYLSKILVKAYYTPEMIDETRCVGCDKCGKVCPTTATYYDREAKKLVFDYEKCVGCGQCVNQCKFDVRKMVRDERNVFVRSKEERLPR